MVDNNLQYFFDKKNQTYKITFILSQKNAKSVKSNEKGVHLYKYVIIDVTSSNFI